ncbi:MAG TPA: DUF1385 domain-containing protein [Ktedonobacteraceae bacterium]|nr:DUF1385 domain-containing protein [Ktedonobacteraceae bacterium]
MAKFYYGGQAVIEGVMMRGRTSVAMALRRIDGSIYLYEEPLPPRLYQNKLLRLPLLRGVFLLWETLVLGSRLMSLSGNVAIGDAQVSALPFEAGSEPAVEGEQPGALPLLPEKPAQSGAALILPLLVSLAFVIVIFFLGPLFVTSLLRNWIGDGWLNLTLEGVIRLALLLGYLYLIGRIPDIQRVFGYHGAEHKAINAMEQGEPLDVAHVRQASRVHTRCGTGFLLLVAVISIFVFALVGSPSLIIKVLSRILLVPVVAGVAYELMRLGAANYRYRVVRWLLAPGLALQGLTTREPDDSMIECAIMALQRVMFHDKPQNPANEHGSPTEPPLALSQ